MNGEETSAVGQRGDKESRRKSGDNIVFVGSKPLVNYVRGVMLQFNKWSAPEVVIKSRGKFISKAVDIVEIAKRSLEGQKIFVKSVDIASESFEANGKKMNVSTMDITLAR
jgi:archaea-specific DNA-binding protein